MCVLFKKSLSSIRLWRYSLFPSRNFFVLLFTFKLEEPLWNWFLYELWIRGHVSVFFPCGYPVVSAQFVAKTVLSSTFYCDHMYIKWLCGWGLFLDSSSPLTYVSVSAPIPHLLNHCSSIISLDIQQTNPTLFFTCVLDVLGPLHRMCLFTEHIWGSLWECTNSFSQFV